LVDDFACRVFAVPAAGRHGKVALHLGEGRRPALHDLPKLPVGQRMADTDVHGSPLTGAILDTNENRCQLTRTTTEPTPSISPTTVSPREIGPTPAGVPVKIRSPGSSRKNFESCAMISAQPHVISAIFPSCRRTPFTASVIRPDVGSPAVAGHST